MAKPLRPTLLAITSSLAVAAISAGGLAACESDDLQGAETQVVKTDIKLDLPAVPEFDVPKPNGDGSHPVPEMRLNGSTYLGNEVKVKGVVLWVYDCAETAKTPEMSDKDVEKLLAEHPEICLKPHFVLGDQAGDKVERGIQVVEYPRPLRKDQKKAWADEMIAEHEAMLKAMPPFKVGDELIVTGVWDITSPGGFQNTDGLLTYKGMDNLSALAE